MATPLIRKIINTPLAPKAIGPYSQAVLIDRTLYVSGQIGLNPKSMELVSGGIIPETNQALENMGAILKAAKVDFSNVMKTTVLLADINDFVTVNDIYKKYFSNKFPARAAYQVANLPKGARIEIEAIAVTDPIIDSVE